MSQLGEKSSLLEKRVGLAVLLCLSAIAGGVFLKQLSFNPAVLIAGQIQPTPKTTEPAANQSIVPLPPELGIFGAPESFTPDNLYDKIDGKAELYLAAGVVGMRCQRFALKNAEDQWLEWFDYDMDNLPQAFSVFSTQRRAEGQTLDLTEYAYKTQNALYFVCGRHYVEAIASSANAPLMEAVLKLAGRFVAANPATTRLPQFELLPADDLVPGSFTLQTTDAFGFDQFKNVFTAQYQVNDAKLMAFVTSCRDADAAAALRDAYRSFLLANGGKEIASQNSSDPGKPIEIMGGFEIVFCRGSFVAGIHAAPTLALAEQIATRLRQRLAHTTE